MVKPRAKITRSNRPENVAGMAYVQIEKMKVAAWTPRPNGEPPLEQVHLLLYLKGWPAPAVMRFKSPDTLGFLIEELARYRRQVWPDAELLDLQSKSEDPPKEVPQ